MIRFTSCELISFSCNLVSIMTFPIFAIAMIVGLGGGWVGRQSSVVIVKCTNVFEKQWCIFKNDKWIRLMEHENAILQYVCLCVQLKFVLSRQSPHTAHSTRFVSCAASHTCGKHARCCRGDVDKLSPAHTKSWQIYSPFFQNIVPKSCGFCCSLHVNVISLPDLTKTSTGPVILAFSSATI